MLLLFGFLMATLLSGTEERNRSLVQDANLFINDLLGEYDEVWQFNLDVRAHNHSLVWVFLQMVEIGLRQVLLSAHLLNITILENLKFF